MEKKAIALMSGGLDSTLAVKLILEQGIEVTALNFKSPFCLCDGKAADGCRSHASVAAGQLGIEVKVIHKGLDYMDVVRSPKYGYGSAMNPCVDCRIYTFRSAKAYMEETGASFIVTGEVLGQRPMSQRRDPMFLIEKESGLEGLIVRPLSAKLLPPTLPEKAGIIDRERLLGISGRSRKEQIQAAEDYRIDDYPCASGGCLLTDKNFGARLKDEFSHRQEQRWSDVKMLTIGRHFRLKDGTKVVLGRNEDENRRISVLGRGGLLLRPDNFKGPTAYVDGKLEPERLEDAGSLILNFSKDGDEAMRAVCYVAEGAEGRFEARNTLSESEIDAMRVR